MFGKKVRRNGCFVKKKLYFEHDFDILRNIKEMDGLNKKTPFTTNRKKYSNCYSLKNKNLKNLKYIKN